MRQAFFIASSFLSWSAVAQVPAFVPYSGRLTDGTGWGQSTLLQMVVRLYDSESAGSLLWSSPPMTVSVVDGYFSVMLSQGTAPDGNPLGVDEIFTKNASVWMTLVMEGQEMVPRQRVGSVPYAITAQTLSGGPILWKPGESLILGQWDGTTMNERVRVSSDGNVGIGTTNPTAKLDLVGNARIRKTGNPEDLLDVEGVAWIGRYGNGANSHALWLGTNKNTLEPVLLVRTEDDGGWNYVRFHGTRWMTAFSFSHESPNGMVTEMTISDGVQIRGGLNIGGNCQASGSKNCDIAETFLSLDNAGPGDVVSLDPSIFKALRLADRPYDPMLAGVVSTEPTLLMGQNDVPEGVAIALAGVVPVKVTLENGPIAVGDLLTSSSTPGHAMRADRPGPVLGKAMAPFDGSQGWSGKIRLLVAPSMCATTIEPVDETTARIMKLENEVNALRADNERLRRVIEDEKARLITLERSLWAGCDP